MVHVSNSEIRQNSDLIIMPATPSQGTQRHPRMLHVYVRTATLHVSYPLPGYTDQNATCIRQNSDLTCQLPPPRVHRPECYMYTSEQRPYMSATPSQGTQRHPRMPYHIATPRYVRTATLHVSNSDLTCPPLQGTQRHPRMLRVATPRYVRTVTLHVSNPL